MARKKAASKTTTDIPVCNTWWFFEDKDCPPPPEDAWCLLHTVDAENEVSIFLGRWHSILKLWLTSEDIAVEANEKVLGYSPVFDFNGELWRYCV